MTKYKVLTSMWSKSDSYTLLVGIHSVIHNLQARNSTSRLLLLLSHFSRVQLCVTPQTVAYRPLHPWDFSRQEYQRDCHFLLQGIFPTQGSNPGLLHYTWTLYPLSHQGSPEFRRAASNSCLSWKGENAETKQEQSRNNSAASGQGPHSTSGNGHNNL